MKFQTINPYNQTVVGEYTRTNRQQLQTALEQSQRAFHAWRRSTVSERQQCFRALAAHIRSHASEHARMATQEMGKLAREAMGEVLKGGVLIDHYVEKAEEYLRDETVHADGQRHWVTLEPLGALLSIMPWNYPYWQIMRFAVPSIMAGNTTLVKPAYETVGCALLLEKAFIASGFPPGVFQVIYPGLEDLQMCFDSDIIRGVSFTGSTQAGRLVYEKAARGLKKVVLELGGSDPFIVLPDADLEKTVAGAIAGRLLNAGQTCIASKRFIVHEQIYDRFVERFRAELAARTPGDPSNEATALAPLFARRAVDPLRRQLQDAKSAGAATLLEVNWVGECSLSPGLLTDVSPDNPLYRQELFAPIAIVSKVKSAAEAIALANDTPFGLAGTVWGQDASALEAVGRELECGAVFYNSIAKSDPRMPFGGVKSSGIGRELGRWGLQEFCNIKGHSFY